MIIETTAPAITAETVKAGIISNNTSAFRMLKNSVLSGFNQVWKNPKFTPQEVLNAFGTDAVALFTLSYKAQLLLKDLNPDYIVLTTPEDYDVTFNEDGSVEATKKVVNPIE